MTFNEGDARAEDDGPRRAAVPPATAKCPVGVHAGSALLSTGRSHMITPKSKSLQGISDLTLLAPIKPGFISALETRTYETRVRHLMKALHALRLTSREYSPIRPFVDAAARIRTIHSLRLAVIDRKLLLAVTFDRPWEPYIRSIWEDIGGLLDVIFCNCENYPLASKHSFDEYMQWVRSTQVETGFFFSASPMTVDDLQYLKQIEQIHRDASGSWFDLQLAAAQATLKDPQQLAAAVADDPLNQPEIIKQGMLALSALHRLVDMYPPEADGEVLLRAAHELLGGLPRNLPAAVRRRFDAQLKWFEQTVPRPRRPELKIVDVDLHDVQSGILSKSEATHGCLLLLAIEEVASVVRFLTELAGEVTSESQCNRDSHVNIAFTHHGLCQLGLPAAQLAKFSQEFREGMEARSGLLGDVRGNHPRNWNLPECNWPEPPVPGSSLQRVELSMVHVVIHLGIQSPSSASEFDDPQYPLRGHVTSLIARMRGMTLLSIQAMRRRDPGHFGYVDGISQPLINQRPAPGSAYPNDVPLGDVLLGHPNRCDFARHDELLTNGSYLVVRKMRQHVEFFESHLQQEASRLAITPDELKAKMMGRTLSGGALANPNAPDCNDFTYAGDPNGTLCPLQAHARRANPRAAENVRIVRRGLSYGPAFDPANPTAGERGLMFLAYNARIAEQFEVIQRWIAGGNGTGIYSGDTDPLLGVPELGDPRTFRFQHQVQGRTALLHAKLTDESARPFVSLEWGLYLFVPSITGLRALLRQNSHSVDQPDVAAGEAVVQRLLALDREFGAGASSSWKAVLEDSESRARGEAANVWAAVRERHGGVLRTSYGVLVCSRELVMQVFANESQRYTATGYLERMSISLGEIYLGRDSGAEYDREAELTNAAIQSITKQEAFESTYRYTQAVLQQLIAAARELSKDAGSTRWELTLDIKELSDLVLARLCEEWFEVPDGKHIKPGGWRWDWNSADAPLCPGHFTAPSRFTFQPHPGDAPRRYAMLHGQSLRAAMNEFVAERRAPGKRPKGRLSKAMFAALPAKKDNDLLARNIVGVMMGFLPSVDGNLRASLFEWIEQRILWEVQHAYLTSSGATPYDKAIASIEQPLMNTMRLRPVPEVTWRRATAEHRLGNVEIQPRDLVVLAIVSATQEDRLRGDASDVYPIFGGNRRSAPKRPHACPAYDSGLGIMLGIVAGLLAAGPMRPTPAPLTVSFSGSLA
jgi:Dyp-type peroxidase family